LHSGDDQVEEQKSTEERVLIDRQSHLQLVIVRILKSRKTIKHQALVIEVISALKDRFKVETTEIKKAIDSLIERLVSVACFFVVQGSNECRRLSFLCSEYMQRQEGNRSVYEYLA
jgi:hypothetical protein